MRKRNSWVQKSCAHCSIPSHLSWWGRAPSYKSQCCNKLVYAWQGLGCGLCQRSLIQDISATFIWPGIMISLHFFCCVGQRVQRVLRGLLSSALCGFGPWCHAFAGLYHGTDKKAGKKPLIPDAFHHLHRLSQRVCDAKFCRDRLSSKLAWGQRSKARWDCEWDNLFRCNALVTYLMYHSYSSPWLGKCRKSKLCELCEAVQ